MMRNFNEDLEDFLKRNAENFKMRPSPGTWESISGKLKEKRRTAGWLTGLFLVIIGFVGYYLSGEAPANIQPGKQLSGAAKPLDNKRSAESNETQLPPAERFHENDPETVTEREISLPASRPVLTSERAAAPLSIAYINQDRILSENAVSQTQSLPDQADPAEQPEAIVYETTIVDEYPLTESSSAVGKEEMMPAEVIDPLSIESVVSAIQLKKLRKTQVQFYITPSISYRNLSENQGYPSTYQGATGVTQFHDIDNAVTHKPDLGIELGVARKYALNEKWAAIAAVQFNISQYSIRAFQSYNESAMIALRSPSSSGGANVTSNTNLRNFNGNKINWLQNIYFQASVPLGVEYKVKRNSRTQFGISGSIQPTYIIGDRAYLLSTDYKNYAEVPWLIRRINVNTSMETFMTYNHGRYNWQVGPQVRYQLLSSFVNRYPIKEHLFDFGMKIGLSVNRKQTK